MKFFIGMVLLYGAFYLLAMLLSAFPWLGLPFIHLIYFLFFGYLAFLIVGGYIKSIQGGEKKEPRE